ARKQRAELRFHFLRILAAGNAYPVRDAQHVAIDRQARDAERVTEHDVGRLAADARKRRQLFHVGRYFAAVFVDQLLRHRDQRARFLTEEPGRQDLRLELLGGCLRERTRVRVTREQRG